MYTYNYPGQFLNIESFKGFVMKPLWIFSYSPRDKNLRGFPDKQNYRWFKYKESFLGFLI